MSFSRRAMLLALDVDLSALSLPGDDLAVALGPCQLGDGLLDIVDIVVNRRRKMIEVTSRNDPAPMFMAGLESVDFDIRAYARGPFESLRLMSGEVFEVNEIIRGVRVRAQLIVRGASLSVASNGRTECRINAVANGPVEVTQYVPPLPDVRRGMAL